MLRVWAGHSPNIITFHVVQFISFLLNVLPSSSLPISLSLDRMFLLWVETGDHSSPVLIKHTLIVGQWQLQGKKRQEREINCHGRDGKRQRWRREREGGEGGGRGGESSHCDRKHGEYVRKLWQLKVSSPLPDGPGPPTWVIRRATPSSGHLTAPS